MVAVIRRLQQGSLLDEPFPTARPPSPGEKRPGHPLSPEEESPGRLLSPEEERAGRSLSPGEKPAGKQLLSGEEQAGRPLSRGERTGQPPVFSPEESARFSSPSQLERVTQPSRRYRSGDWDEGFCLEWVDAEGQGLFEATEEDVYPRGTVATAFLTAAQLRRGSAAGISNLPVQEWRQAVVLAEILGPPRSLQPFRPAWVHHRR